MSTLIIKMANDPHKCVYHDCEGEELIADHAMQTGYGILERKVSCNECNRVWIERFAFREVEIPEKHQDEYIKSR